MNTSTSTLSLYIHFPWCVKKCPYCDFNSHTAKANPPKKEYVNQLINELTQQKPIWHHRHIHSVFMGGGTPSLFEHQQLRPLFEYLYHVMGVDQQTEITLEANPGTVDQAHFEGYRQLGINRLSLGVQSFNDQALKKLGRIHDGQQAHNAVKAARNAGFNNINLDIMFALPQQSLPEAINDLQQAIDLQPEHLSWYQLTLEPNTLFHRFPPILPDNDLSADIQEQGSSLLSQHQYQQYEVSAYAKNNQQCRHNLQYWTFGDYLGIGAGAHSKVSDLQTKAIRRHWNFKNPKKYLDPDIPFEENHEWVPPQRCLFEFFLNRFRLLEPINEKELISNTGYHLNQIQSHCQKQIESKLLKIDNKQLFLTEKGRHFLNDVLEHWL